MPESVLTLPALLRRPRLEKRHVVTLQRLQQRQFQMVRYASSDVLSMGLQVRVPGSAKVGTFRPAGAPVGPEVACCELETCLDVILDVQDAVLTATLATDVLRVVPGLPAETDVLVELEARPSQSRKGQQRETD